MVRVLFLAYGFLAYLIFLATFLYLIGFLGNLFVPKSIDSGPQSAAPIALTIDCLLLALFAVQHSLMARPAFKRVWTKVVPTPIERSTYVLLSSLVLALLVWQWRPLPGIVWSAEGLIGQAVLLGLFGFGFLLVSVATLLINHSDLFGLRQVWLHFKGRSYTPPEFRSVALYNWIRHPLLLGFLIAIWAAPTMSAGRLLFALFITAYVLVGVRLEERDLEGFHGDVYSRYKKRVPMLIPWKWSGRWRRGGADRT